MRPWADDALRLVAPKRSRRGKRAAAPFDMLTPAELRVIALVALGWEDKRIAAELGISVFTAKTHLTRVRERLELDNRVQVAVWYVRAGRRQG